ncbi:ABC-type xylose transport system, periplasmic component [Desulfosporosinus acidiphilus SJ4]|uniref:ABC-type xylose transport system, periplasmic component n=1 Tax=Desulfosporosinus acidiphilus (strain DSM 22704 / JCM 16185 / SJ4) TaxID=646529 RepID=I4D2R0_DESAJ|nr:multiple monosaccharide ABC transporter substrate-binding protein [Desulfosporosinus acidiphilus]AFM40084.1 ABC-type xylose transport system, periplasmic component [Desulfosporosinus acidiphilus SJ4]
MKKVLSVLMLFFVMVFATACGASSSTASSSSTSGSTAASNGKIAGIAMPTKTSQRWIDDGNNMVKSLQALGYKTDLQYADNDVQNQISQIENMITKGANVLVIASIDGTALTDVLKKAHDAKIPVISYDRLIMNSPYVDYYATFDNFKVGVLQAGYIEKALGLKDGKGPFNIELFAGSPDDNNAKFFFDGAMSVLQPYITSGKLVVRSGQTAYAQVGTLRWDGATAQARMDNILSKNYTTAKVDAVLSPYDGISIGIISSLKGVGYGTASQKMPIITGQDCEVASVKSIIAGEQTSSIFKDTRVLAKKAAEMANDVLQGKTPVVNDTKSYNNGVKIVPSFLCDPVVVDKTNYQKILIDSGYYTADKLK